MFGDMGPALCEQVGMRRETFRLGSTRRPVCSKGPLEGSWKRKRKEEENAATQDLLKVNRKFALFIKTTHIFASA